MWIVYVLLTGRGGMPLCLITFAIFREMLLPFRPFQANAIKRLLTNLSICLFGTAFSPVQAICQHFCTALRSEGADNAPRREPRAQKKPRRRAGASFLRLAHRLKPCA